MRVQEEDRGGEQETKVLQLADAVADLLQVLLPWAMRSASSQNQQITTCLWHTYSVRRSPIATKPIPLRIT